MNKLIGSPFFIYSASFFVILILLAINVSDLYVLNYDAIFIIVFITIIISFFIAILTRKFIHNKVNLSFIGLSSLTNINCFLIMFFLSVIFLLDCTSVGVIPIIEVIRGNTYRYMDFGVPLLHAFLIMYGSIVCFSNYARYLKFKKKRYLYLFIYTLFLPIFYINRQVFIYELIGILILYLSLGHVDFKKISKVFISCILCLVFFSIIGNLRTVSDSQGKSDNNASKGLSSVLEINTPYFPSILSWPYAYLITPYGNLDYNYRINQKYEYSAIDFSRAIRMEILPDFIAKRLVEDTEKDLNKSRLVLEMFNVVTCYSNIYVLYGLYGIFIYFTYFCLYIIFIIILMPQRFFCVCIAGLCATSFLSIYANMLIQQTQFLFPFLVAILSKLRFGHIKFI